MVSIILACHLYYLESLRQLVPMIRLLFKGPNTNAGGFDSALPIIPVCSGRCIEGAGDTRATAIIMFLTVLLIRPGAAIFAINVLGLGLEGAWLALIADQLVRSLLVLLRFNSGKWKSIKV